MLNADGERLQIIGSDEITLCLGDGDAVADRFVAGGRKVNVMRAGAKGDGRRACLLYTSPSPRDLSTSRMPSSA